MRFQGLQVHKFSLLYSLKNDMQYPLTDKKDFGYNSQKPAHISQIS